MTTTAAAAECKANVGPDFTLAEAYDLDYLDADTEGDNERAARQALNTRMAEWYGIG